MRKLTETTRAFWSRRLIGAGLTTIPRWTLAPLPGVAEHEATIPADLLALLRQRAEELSVSLDSVLLAAHARVLSSLSGERELTTGYLPAAGQHPFPCRLTTHSLTWRSLIRDTHHLSTELLSHQDVALDALRHELGLSEPPFETVLDLAGKSAQLPRDIVLWVAVVPRGHERLLRLRYRTEVLNAEAAARICGYHLKALALLAADLHAEHERQSLLSPEELHFQLEGLAGRQRDLPNQPFHVLFEHQVEAHPDAIAALDDRQQWSYHVLNAQANRLGRALLARGLRPEGVVAVVMERTLDWMAAVLAILKAGGVYLPIEPHFPAHRIARILSRAQCALVLTEAGSTTTLDQALHSLPEVQTLFVDSASKQGESGANLGLDMASDQLAYLYFTSGSTGEPKGALCSQRGMLNHLYAKIDDLSIGPGQVVAQTAPQCFDISLWQLLSALLVGGRTLLVAQEAILDVQRFFDTILAGGVSVLQVVPSYLDVLLSSLEQHPRDLAALRYVSVTGEALKKELTQRWFAAEPEIKLVNAYGLTETSDDTTHEIMDRVPDRERVPLGRPVNNVEISIRDHHLSPVPLGAPGAIVFSGICLGRGYVNDPQRTQQAFVPDPHREGKQLYLGGDYGRWLPEGKVEFLGRRDSQVKISGFRIEIGEIEKRLLQVAGVREGAVVVGVRADESKRLVAFYAAERPLDVAVLQDRLRESLPHYMVPSLFHWQQRLPLTANGKIDRTSLTARARDLDTGEEDDHEPRTASEQHLAVAWAKVLGISQEGIGRQDHFFARGGTSLSAVRLAILLERAVSLEDITCHPILADLAKLIDSRSERSRRPQ